MVDLHIHTNCSDGTDDPISVLQKAERLGLTHISITDHNNVDAYFKFGNYKKHYSGKLILGVEPECHYRGRIIELLGYNIDVDKMRKSLKGVYASRDRISKNQTEGAYKQLVNAGFKFSPDVLETLKRSKHYYSTCHFHEDLKKYPENRELVSDDILWENSIKFARHYFGSPDSPMYVDETSLYPPVELAYKVIRDAGGLVFLPHVFMYGDDSIPILEGLITDFKIDGIECYYPTYTKEQTEFLLEFCNKHNLLISGGSDYHGSQRPNEMGTELPLQDWFK